MAYILTIMFALILGLTLWNFILMEDLTRIEAKITQLEKQSELSNNTQNK